MSLLAFEISLALLLVLPNILCCAISTASQLDHQADTLLRWKSSLNGPISYGRLRTWSIRSSPCNWTGVTCSAMVPHGHGPSDAVQVVAKISLRGCHLEGRLDQLHFADLSELSVLELSNNFLNGSIPPSIGNLTKLTYLGLSSNFLHGSIPNSIGNLTKLAHLDLSVNDLSGSIPASIGNLSKLIFLGLSYNSRFRGHIPDTLGMLVYLEEFHLGSNNLSGPIPRSIANLVALELLDLSNNRISGMLGPELGFLKNLSNIDFSSNQLIGSIPPQIVQCRFLSILRISDNLLTGPIPEGLGYYLWLLRELDLSKNNLSGTIPVTLSKLPQLSDLNLSHNNLSGRVDATFTFSVNTRVSLDHNIDLCGDPEYGLTWCHTPEFNKKFKEGKTDDKMAILLTFASFCFIRIAIGSMTIVYYRRKSSKVSDKSRSHDMVSIWNFDGKIAFQDILDAIECFDDKYCIGTGGYGSVFRAELQGGSIYAIKLLYSVEDYTDDKAFHAEIQVLIKVRHRCNNFLNGSIPSIGNLTKLAYLDLSNNSLSGPIPASIGNLASLKGLSLFNNRISGMLPPELGFLKKLWNLDLGSNQLIGSIPPQIAQCRFLSFLVISDNLLTGPIPQRTRKLFVVKRVASEQK